MNSFVILISENEIVQLFKNGLSVKVLTNKVAVTERKTKAQARIKVEKAIYADMMKRGT